MSKKNNKKHSKKIRNLVALCSLCGIVFSVSTYAWFIGMKTVNVASFDIDIATTEGLFLSMDGENWSYNLYARNAEPYAENTNTWATEGLIPMSTVGDMDSTVSRMKIFEKGSLTAVTGGYRLLASRVDNYNNGTDGKIKQGKGYVAFDLFIKNMSGTEYYTENNVLNEEAIYLTTNSAVTVSTNGGEAGTGIENSVRVAFTQIGRVKGDTTTVGNITGITCADVEASDGQVQVTGICRDAQIWEPNDTKHVNNAISWYDTSCKVRKSEGTDVNDSASYDEGNCTGVTDGTANKTYAISRALQIADNVNIYDGATYNTYTANSIDYATYAEAPDKSTYKLVDFPYFTDTMKDKTGTARPTFMTLAPNSITKLRVYIYIEGQDVDNYDFASLGKKISINFGFTKERYTETDVDYHGPSTNITPTGGQ